MSFRNLNPKDNWAIKDLKGKILRRFRLNNTAINSIPETAKEFGCYSSELKVEKIYS
jgi:hypothetical protein